MSGAAPLLGRCSRLSPLATCWRRGPVNHAPQRSRLAGRRCGLDREFFLVVRHTENVGEALAKPGTDPATIATRSRTEQLESPSSTGSLPGARARRQTRKSAPAESFDLRSEDAGGYYTDAYFITRANRCLPTSPPRSVMQVFPAQDSVLEGSTRQRDLSSLARWEALNVPRCTKALSIALGVGDDD